MKYHKLVRDGIPDKIRANNEPFKSHVADKAEYWAKLKLKLGEEVAEFNSSETIDELADLMEVMLSILKEREWSVEQLEQVRIQKYKKLGGFNKRIILDES